MVHRVAKFIGTESRMVVAMVGWGEGSYYLMATVTTWEDESVLEMDGGDGCITM